MNLVTKLSLFILLTICNHLVLVRGIYKSMYTKTRTVGEKEKCLDTSFNRKVAEIKTKSVIWCSLKCSEHSECRRFMFNTVDKTCLLYKAGENCPVSRNIAQNVCYRQKHKCGEVSCIRCPVGYYGDRCENIIKDCSDGMDRDVVPLIKSLTYLKPGDDIIEVLCNFKRAPGYTVIQYRTNDCRKPVFNKTWSQYASGFGNAHGSYWLGLTHLYNILHYDSHSYELHVKAWTMSSFIQCYYLLFNIENEENNFKITVGSYEKDGVGLGNSLDQVNNSINGKPFSTFDRDFSNGCPNKRGGGWWYLDDPTCLNGNPTGLFSSLQWLNNDNDLTNFTALKLRMKRL